MSAAFPQSASSRVCRLHWSSPESQTACYKNIITDHHRSQKKGGEKNNQIFSVIEQHTGDVATPRKIVYTSWRLCGRQCRVSLLWQVAPWVFRLFFSRTL